MNTRYKPSLMSQLENESNGVVAVVVLLQIFGTFIMSAISVAVFAFLFTTLGFWYSVAFITVLRLILYMLQEYSKYRMEQHIMKGGK